MDSTMGIGAGQDAGVVAALGLEDDGGAIEGDGGLRGGRWWRRA
jgi:hypothetical protein